MNSPPSRNLNGTSSLGIPETDTVSTSSNESSEDGDHQSTEKAEGNYRTPVNLVMAKRLAEKVASVLAKVKPFNTMLPEAFLRELSDVNRMAEQCMSIKPPPQPVVHWRFDVYNLPMETWKRRGPPTRRDFSGTPPALVAYYQIIGPSSGFRTDPSDLYPDLILEPAKHSDRMLNERNLQRIVILSDVLHDELLPLTSDISRVPIIVAPPYKLLFEYLPQLKSRLAQLKTESEELTGAAVKPDGDINKSATSDQVNDSEAPGDSLDKESDRDSNKVETQSYLDARISHLRCLTEFIDNRLGDLVQLRADIENCSLDKIAFEDLWHLFNPGDLIFSMQRGRAQLSKVYYVAGGQMRKRNQVPPDDESDQESASASNRLVAGTWKPLNLCVYTMDFDGKNAGPVRNNILIHHYPGQRMISDLAAYPLQFHPDKGILDRFEKRGREFMSSVGHRYYEGLTVSMADLPVYSSHDSRRGASSFTRYEDIVSDVYVDFEEFYEEFEPPDSAIHALTIPPQDLTEISEVFPSRLSWVRPGPPSQPGFPPPPPMMDSRQVTSNHSGHEVDAVRTERFFAQNRKALERFKPSEDTENLTAEFYQLLPHVVPGYAFRYRKWYLLDIDLLQHINPDRYSGFDDLVIPSNYKHLLSALVNNHTSGVQKRRERLRKQGTALKGSEIDIVPGKGEGLIILLHGPPGSGKTSTAETIAAYTKRPLYSITCGDIGLDPEDAEATLDEHTFRADKWGCVLLLDEADVFLMQRTWKEIERNVLVSIFLRQLEYYSGILFLTTNRPGTIDEAFKSRIHVSLRYPAINLITTIQMWNNILARLETDNASAEIKVVFDTGKLLAFAEKHFKSREQTDSMWNGRQIRNAFQTAIALGHAERTTALREANMSNDDAAAHRNQKKWMTVKLTVRNFRRIAETTNEFEDYMVSLRGKDADNARETEVRDDNYDPQMLPAMSAPGRKNYGQGGTAISSMSRSERGGSGWGRWEESITTGGRGGRREIISLEPTSSGTTNNRNSGKGKAPAAGRHTTVLHVMDSEGHDEDEDDDDDDDDDDEEEMDGDN